MSESQQPQHVLERDAERLKFFTDAVVAIALTLLILPLMDAVAGAAGEGVDTAAMLKANVDQLASFFISFAVIATFWTVHHRTFAHVRHYNAALLWLNLLWMLTIVLTPVTTAITSSLPADALQALLYVGTMTVSSLVLFVMAVVVFLTPGLQMPGDPLLVGSLTATGLMAALYLVALAISAAVPGIGYFSLFLLSLLPVLHRVFTPMVARRLSR